MSKEEIDFHLLMALAFNDLPRKKSDQLASLLGVVMKRCMDKAFHWKFQVEEMCTESHDIRTKDIKGVNSIMNLLQLQRSSVTIHLPA